MKAVDTSTPEVYGRNDPKSPISQAILDLIKEKCRPRRLYNNTQDPDIKSTINRLQQEIRTKINQESTISWEKLCNYSNGSSKNVYENILKTMVSLVSTSQALGNPSQQMTIFSSLSDHHGKLQSGRTCNSGLSRC